MPNMESPICCLLVKGFAGGAQVGCTLLVGIGGAALAPLIVGAAEPKVQPDNTRLVVPAERVVKINERSEGFADGAGAGHPAVIVIVVVASELAAMLGLAEMGCVLTAAGAVKVQSSKDAESVELAFGSTRAPIM